MKQLKGYRDFLLVAGLAISCLILFCLALTVGSVMIPLDAVLSILLGEEAQQRSWQMIVLNFRVPKTLTALLAGAALAVSGLKMQTLFRNSLADPFVLGISAGASLGVALIVLGATQLQMELLIQLGGVGQLGIVLAAILGSITILMIVLSVARKVRDNSILLITGLMFGYFTHGIVQILIYFSESEQVQQFQIWTFGSFRGVGWKELGIFSTVIIIGLLLSLLLIKPLNGLLLGEEYARSMGVPVDRTRWQVIFGTAILTGGVTAFCGPVSFLGIAVPHMCRSLLKSADHRVLLPAVIFTGAFIALLSEIIAQVPGQQITLPLNAVTALFGAPIVIRILLRQRSLGGL